VSEEARQAAEVFERVLRGLGPRGPASTPQPPRAERVRLAQLRTAAARTIDLYGQLLQSALEAYTDLAAGALAPGAPAPADAALVLAGRAGAELVAPVWVHNLTRAPVVAALRLTALVAPGGERLEGGAFRPPELAVAAGASGEATLTVVVPRGAPAGVYHGHVLSSAAPESALALRLTIT
jgi:hypothetical protein